MTFGRTLAAAVLWCGLGCGLDTNLGSSAAQAQVYPDRLIKVIVPFVPGSPVDAAARVITQHIQTRLGQNMVIENKPGGGTTIGLKAVMAAPADGYTLLMHGSAGTTIYPAVMRQPAFDTLRDLTPITPVVLFDIILCANPDLPFKTVKEFVAYAKANPGKLSYGSAGVGAMNHVGAEWFRMMTGIDIVHVPYRGGGATINDLLGRHIKVAFLSLSTAVPHLSTGKIRILAVVEKTRYEAMPDIPTIGETVPGFEMSSWHGIFAPAATPAPLLARLNAAIRNVLVTDAVKEKLAALGVAVATSTPEELADIVKRGLVARGELVKAANIQPE